MDILTDDKEGCYFNRTVKFFYEKSNKYISDHWRHRDYVVVTLGMAVCFIVIFSNLLVIAAILKNRRFHFPIYYLLGNLALSDLFAEEAESEDTKADSSITVAEVSGVVATLYSDKAPGVDEFRPYILKALDVEGLSWLTRLINIELKAGAVPLDWVITLFTLPGKVYSRVLE